MVYSTDRFPVAADDHGTIRLSPTDISQFIRLEQCERYLRLRLHERTVDAIFMRDYGVTPQSIPPLLTRSGATFEAQIVHTVASHYRTISFVAERTQARHRANDNDQVLSLVHDLRPSETIVLFQRRVQARSTAGSCAVSRSVFTLFSTDEDTSANSQLWKNLLRRTCIVKLWEGERAGKRVEVWGNHRCDEMRSNPCRYTDHML